MSSVAIERAPIYPPESHFLAVDTASPVSEPAPSVAADQRERAPWAIAMRQARLRDAADTGLTRAIGGAVCPECPLGGACSDCSIGGNRVDESRDPSWQPVNKRTGLSEQPELKGAGILRFTPQKKVAGKAAIPQAIARTVSPEREVSQPVADKPSIVIPKADTDGEAQPEISEIHEAVRVLANQESGLQSAVEQGRETKEVPAQEPPIAIRHVRKEQPVPRPAKAVARGRRGSSRTHDTAAIENAIIASYQQKASTGVSAKPTPISPKPKLASARLSHQGPKKRQARTASPPAKAGDMPLPSYKPTSHQESTSAQRQAHAATSHLSQHMVAPDDMNTNTGDYSYTPPSSKDDTLIVDAADTEQKPIVEKKATDTASTNEVAPSIKTIEISPKLSDEVLSSQADVAEIVRETVPVTGDEAGRINATATAVIVLHQEAVPEPIDSALATAYSSVLEIELVDTESSDVKAPDVPDALDASPEASVSLIEPDKSPDDDRITPLFIEHSELPITVVSSISLRNTDEAQVVARASITTEEQPVTQRSELPLAEPEATGLTFEFVDEAISPATQNLSIASPIFLDEAMSNDRIAPDPSRTVEDSGQEDLQPKPTIAITHGSQSYPAVTVPAQVRYQGRSFFASVLAAEKMPPAYSHQNETEPSPHEALVAAGRRHIPAFFGPRIVRIVTRRTSKLDLFPLIGDAAIRRSLEA
jgi:hypothetical protein